MNQLSWLLYAADVVGGLGSLSAFLALVSALALVLTLCVRVGIAAHEADYGRTAPENVMKLLSKTQKWAATVFGLAALVAVLTPEKETLYAIAASEVGERVVSSPTANKAVQALNHWLDEQINEAAPQGKPEPDK